MKMRLKMVNSLTIIFLILLSITVIMVLSLGSKDKIRNYNNKVKEIKSGFLIVKKNQLKGAMDVAFDTINQEISVYGEFGNEKLIDTSNQIETLLKIYDNKTNLFKMLSSFEKSKYNNGIAIYLFSSDNKVIYQSKYDDKIKIIKTELLNIKSKDSQFLPMKNKNSLCYFNYVEDKNYKLILSLDQNIYLNQIKVNVITKLSNTKFGDEGKGYFFILDDEKRIKLHPELRKNNNTDLNTLTKKVEKDQFLYYSWGLDHNKRDLKRIAYTRYIPELNWYLSASLDLDNIEKQINQLEKQAKSELTSEMRNMLLVLATVLIILMIIIKFTKKRINLTIDTFVEFFQSAAYSERKIDLNKIYFKEFLKLATAANNMLHEKIQIQEELKKLATTDGLTKLFNRRYFMVLYNRDFMTAKRYVSPISVLMVDIDHFKSINDTYGHAAGDRVLQEVSKIMTDSLRKTDILGRIGGEEFAVVLPNTDGDSALIVAERIRKEIESTEIDIGEQLINITISIGAVSSTPARSDDPKAMLSMADDGLYKAKESGRNKIIYTPKN